MKKLFLGCLAAAFAGLAPQVHAQGSSYSFFNTNPITINDASAASPYPSTINVSGLNGVIIFDVNLTLYNFNHTFPGDVGILLVGPGGQQVLLDGRVGGGTDAVNAFITFDDEAALSLTALIVSGSFRPAAVSTPTFAAPAPADAGNLRLSVFDGTSPDGVWSLYVQDFASGDNGSIASGYSLTITAGLPVVPEPSTWALLSVGIVGLGVVTLRRRQVVRC